MNCIKYDDDFLFSIVMAVYNTECYLDEAISSVINQSIGFKDNVQLILVDDGSTDNSKNVLLKYQQEFPDNIVVLSQENQGQASARNLGLQYVKGKYVNFLDSDDFISENALEEVFNFYISNNDINIVSIPIFLFDRILGIDDLNRLYHETRIIDLLKEPNSPLLSISSTFFSFSLINKFNKTYFDLIEYSEDSLFINKLLLEESKYGVVNTAKYYYRQRLSFNGVHDHISYSDYYYTKRLDDFHNHIMQLSMENNGFIIDFIQYNVLYDLKCLFYNSQINYYIKSDNNEFFEKVHGILKKIDEKNILDNHFLNNELTEFFIKLKNDDYKNNLDHLINIVSSFSDKKVYYPIKVSVIIPVYNVEKYLEECLTSVVNQSFKEIEIICINDGSTDDSLKILKNFAKLDSRIRIISKENEGQGTARNIGIKEAIGEYIGFVDSDDYITEDMFKKLYECANSNDLDLVMCYVSTFDESNNEKNDNAWYYTLKCFDGFDKKIFNHIDTKEFTHEISVTPYNKLYKRNLLIDNNIYFPKGVIFEDEVFYYDVYLNAKKISIVPENLYIYRINREGSTVSFDSDTNFIDIISVFQMVRDVLKKNNVLKIYKTQVYNKFIHYCLLRYSQTSSKYRYVFWRKMKDDFSNIIDFSLIETRDSSQNDNSQDSSDLLPAYDLETRVKERAIKVCSSNYFGEFRLKDSEKLFSIVMAVYNTELYLDEAILSVINQSIGFVHNVQLILVDDGSTDNSKNILLKYQQEFPDNIVVLSQENQGQASARNLGLQYVKGKYVNFLDSDDYFSYNALKDVYEFFVKHGGAVDVVSLPLIQFGRINGEHVLNYKFSKTRVINLVKEPNNPQLHISSSFIHVDALDGLKFPTKFMGSEDGHLLLKILMKKKALGAISTSKYFYRKREDFSSTLDVMIVNYTHYTPRLKYHFMELIDISMKRFNEVPKFLQYSLIYDLQWILNISNNNVFKTDLEKNEFAMVLNNILKFIDDDVILNNKNIKNTVLKNYIYSLKNNKNVVFNDDGSSVIIKTNDKVYDRLEIHKFWLDIVEIRDNHLIISGIFNSLFDRDYISIVANKISKEESQLIVGKLVEYSSRPDNKFLLDTWQFNNSFDLKIPLDKNEKSKIELLVCYHKDNDNSNYDEDNLIKFQLVIDFNRFFAITNDTNYITDGQFIVVFKDNSFFVSKYSFINMVKLENRILEKFQESDKENYISAFKLRRMYLTMYPFVKFIKMFKSIYLFSDRIDMAGDNAEALFNYAIKQKDSNIKYFVISEDCEDYERLKNQKHVIKFNSLKHKLLYLFADKIISSHPDDELFDPFFEDYKLYSNLFNSKKYFLQHGVTKDDVSSWLRKFDKNISLITTVSSMEQESFLNSENGYDDEITAVLGFPRYDKLHNVDTKKQILIMPTWVNEFSNEIKFESTDYFIKLYDLLHNEELFKLCDKFGYEIIFRPHPMLLKYLELFEVPEFISLELNKSYSELFNESALLLTDYSSVAFDFAYLKKPVIYYQYYDYYNFDLSKSYFKYDCMGFGDVIKDETDLLNKIEYYLINECNMEEEYINRVDNFFEYTDNLNCKRNYDWINEH